MIELDFSRCVLPPFEHQKHGVRHLVSRQNAALFDEMGVGKTKQTIDAAQFLWEAGEIDAAIVIAPASVRGVWDAEGGEIRKHSWAPTRTWRFDRTHTFPERPDGTALDWVVISYAYLRQREELAKLLARLKHRRFLLVLDESSYVKSRQAQQTKAAKAVSRLARRRVILNGTPVANNLLDLWSQFDILDPDAIEGMNFFHFRARYALMGGYLGKQVIGYRDADRLKAQLSPWILRREKKDCLDLPDKTFVQIPVPVSAECWRMYREMRDEMVAWLNDADASTASQAAVKATRLSQLTSGFLGGVDVLGKPLPPVPIDDSKQKALLEWLETVPRPVVVWCRFNAEIRRLHTALLEAGLRSGWVAGGQSDGERQATLDAFYRGDLDVLVGQPQAGGFGLNLTRSSTVAYLSTDYNMATRLQSEDRVHRPGQVNRVTYVDFVATSPEGRKTIDHAVLAALRKKQDLARWTTADWRRALEDR